MTSGTAVPLELPSVWMNQAGTLGFSPSRAQLIAGQIFVTNPVSLLARTPANDRDMLEFPGGLLLHTGLVNPGWKALCRKFQSHWAQTRGPVWVHMVGQDPAEIGAMVRDCEGMGCIAAVELGVPPGCPREEMMMLMEAARGELPLILNVSAGVDFCLLQRLPPTVSAVTLGVPRGRLSGEDGRIISGRLHGPGLFPAMLETLHALRGLEVPVILGGICNLQDANTALQSGAAVIQMDRLCWAGELPDSPVD